MDAMTSTRHAFDVRFEGGLGFGVDHGADVGAQISRIAQA